MNTNEQSPLAKVIARRRSDVLAREGYIALAFRILGLALAAWLLLNEVFLVMQAGGNAMFPAVKDGDLILGYRLQQGWAQNDVVVYTQGGGRCVGRIVARGDDVVTLDESGELRVNGTPQGGGIMYPTYPKEGLEYPLRVPEGQVFILGDYRTQSTDSRDFGPIPIEAVEAKVITILRRRGL